MINVIIAVDAMGGDAGPSATLPAIRLFLEKHSSAEVYVFGPIALLEPWVDCLPPLMKKRICLFHSPEVIENHLSSKEAIRRKNSSMRMAIESVKSGQANAIVSGGHTGALMALSKILLTTLPGISRPAIAKALPLLKTSPSKSHIVMLDLGANVECTAQNLLEFAMLGDALARCLHSDKAFHPIIKLLNIGTEEKKGHLYIQEAAFELSRSQLCYEGFIEPNEIFSGSADVIITDGFTGNVVLKTAEGVARLFKERVKNALSTSWIDLFGGLLIHNSLEKNIKMVDPVYHNGAFILGLHGVVIKSHGNAQTAGFLRALDYAASQVESDMLEKIRQNFGISQTNDLPIQVDLH
jgi:glycerol-3-phosphate acyltransferase PlsX